MSAHYQVDRPTNVERFNASHTNMHASSLNLQAESSRSRQLDAGRQEGFASRPIWNYPYFHVRYIGSVVTNINQLE